MRRNGNIQKMLAGMISSSTERIEMRAETLFPHPALPEIQEIY
jgi:hypothetical protein